MSVNVVPYQAKWADDFVQEAQQLRTLLAPLSADFYHIGSTSIPGCRAKPILDILGVVADVTRVDAFVPLGEYERIQRYDFRKRTGTYVNLHIFEDTDPEVERHLRFWDYLRRHPEARQQCVKEIDILAALEADRLLCPPLKKTERKKEWTLQAIIQAMEANKHLHMTCFTKYIPAIERVFEPDVTVVRSDIPSDTFNYILDAHFSPENASTRVAHVIGLYRKANLPFSWWVGECDTPKDLEAVLTSQGLKFKEMNVGMYLDLDRFTPPKTVSALDFVRATHSSHLKSFSQVVVAVGEDPRAFDQLYSKIPPILYREGSNLEMTIAYAQGTAVGIGILLLYANVAGLYYIATVPAEQKKGYGTAMMVHLLQRAKERGFHRAVLQASAAGKNLYERLGFRACCHFKEYSCS